MKALYKAGRGKESVSLQERPLPTVNETDNVLIRVRACAICGMDHQIYNDRFPCTPPFIMGHEFVGTVEQVLGSASVAPGDRVICEPHMYACGVCDACRSGLPQLCDSRRSVGIQRDGAMAPYIAVPSRYLHKVPDSIPDKLACLLEPFCLLVDNLGIPVQEEHAKTVVVIAAAWWASSASLRQRAAARNRSSSAARTPASALRSGKSWAPLRFCTVKATTSRHGCWK